jgi:branched-chain amino acid aminotransferase
VDATSSAPATSGKPAAPLTRPGFGGRIEPRNTAAASLLSPANQPMSLQIYISGKFYDKENAKVSVYDHGFLYGDGVFEGMRSYGGKVFRLKQHLDRLWNSAKAIWLKMPISQEEMAKAVNDTLAKNSIKDGYIRLIVTRGAGALGLDPNRCSEPQVIVIADHIQLYPQEMYANGLEIVTASTIRNHTAALNPRIKSLNYLNNIMAKIEGLQAGCVEALMLNAKGEVAECTADNIFIVRGGVLQTPPIDAGILEGITREAVIELAGELKIPVQQIALTRHDIFIADECLITGSAAEIIPVVKLDSRVIGDGKPGPLTKKLTERFHRLTRE